MKETYVAPKTMSYSVQNYVAPKTMSYSVQNEGVLCSSIPTVGGSASDPSEGVSAGFYETDVNSLF